MSYQRIYKPRLFVSWPLYQYAIGQMDSSIDSGSVINEDVDLSKYDYNDRALLKLIQLTPADYIKLPIDTSITADGSYSYYSIMYKLFKDETDYEIYGSVRDSFDFFMCLGHNLKTCNMGFQLYGQDNDDNSNLVIGDSFVNAANTGYGIAPEHNGWTWCDFGDFAALDNKIKLSFFSYNQVPPCNELTLGSVLWGKSFKFPHNADIEQVSTFDYGIKTKESKKGKAVTQAHWTSRDNWPMAPFELTDINYPAGATVNGEAVAKRGDQDFAMTGKRRWVCKFSFMAPEDVVGQNLMKNDLGWSKTWEDSGGVTQTETDYEVDGSDNSLYSLHSPADTDFFSIVINRTLGGNLPMVMQLDALEGGNPDNFAIVRIANGFNMSHVGKDLFEVEMELVEQI